MEERLVSIVKRSAIQGIPDVTTVKEGEVHRVKYQHDKKTYDAKVLKISDDINILKKMEQDVAEGLANALEEQIEPPTHEEEEVTVTQRDQNKDGTRQEKGKKAVNAVSKKKRPAEKQSEKSKEQKVDHLGPLSQVKAKAAAQREVFKNMVTEQAFMALPPQEDLASDCQTSMESAAPLAPAANYVGDLEDTWPHSLPRTSSPLPLSAPSCAWGQGQPSYLQELREVSNFANTIMDPVQQDHLLTENRELKTRIQSLEAQLQMATDTSLIASTSDCSAGTPVLPIVAEKNCQFLEHLAAALRKNRECSQLNQSSAEVLSDVSISTSMDSLDFSMDISDVSEYACVTLIENRVPHVEQAISSDSESEEVTGESEKVTGESEKVTETSESTQEAKVELVAGMGVFISKTQYSTLMLMSKSKTASQFVRVVLLTLFTTTELKRGSAVGGRVSLKDGQKSRSLPLDPKRMAALKAFVLKRYRTDACPVALKEAEFNRIINCKCGELRAASRKDKS
ncbi:hypothetical protein HOLleu_35297 [Holothuria leucospilota]|uniref:BEN domain-containing protein n=1 Tax=Holothuria leucospilota TaxID=206669 RepID=A0A9Q0YR93_HOLLE|nr:hypothetical protein HOLleu_35297 [Holothuria leucospilota]